MNGLELLREIDPAAYQRVADATARALDQAMLSPSVVAAFNTWDAALTAEAQAQQTLDAARKAARDYLDGQAGA